MAHYCRVIIMQRMEELTEYFKNLGYQVNAVENNKLEITKNGYNGFYLKILAEEELTILEFAIATKDFGINYHSYTTEVNVYVRFSEGYKLNMSYAHPFLFSHLDKEEFELTPVTSLVINLLTQTPVSAELIAKIKEITREIDEDIKEA